MPKNTRFFLLVTSVFILFISSGCRKLIEYLDKNPNGDANLPPIKSFAADMGFGLDTMHFTYDQWKNPLTTACTQKGYQFGSATEFVYDNQHRLVAKYNFVNGPQDSAVIPVPPGNPYFNVKARFAVVFSKYFYQGNSTQPYADSIYHPVLVLNGQVVYVMGQPLQTIYTYDGYGRMTVADEVEGTVHGPIAFSYDANGNRVAGSDAIYDNKTNFLRTNKVWQFLARDYSVNNHFPNSNATYNSYGLPLTTTGSTGSGPEGMPFLSMDLRPYNSFTIEYVK